MKTLYLICPTDFLESTIHQVMRGEKFFYTCLGNQHCLYHNIVSSIRSVIKLYSIDRILFTARSNNAYMKHLIGTTNLLIEKKIAEHDGNITHHSSERESKFEQIDNFLSKQVSDLHKELNTVFDCQIGYIVFNSDNLTDAQKIKITYPSFT